MAARLFTILFILQTLLCMPVQAGDVAVDGRENQLLVPIHQAQIATNTIAFLRNVTNQLIINAAEGIDNFGASIRAGGTASLNGKYLNNDNGLIQARTLVTDIKGDISNNRGRIVASNGGFLQAGGNIAANEGQFISDAGKFVLDAGGDTSTMRVYTDRAGNLITAFPVRGKK